MRPGSREIVEGGLGGSSEAWEPRNRSGREIVEGVGLGAAEIVEGVARSGSRESVEGVVLNR